MTISYCNDIKKFDQLCVSVLSVEVYIYLNKEANNEQKWKNSFVLIAIIESDNEPLLLKNFKYMKYRHEIQTMEF